MEKRRKIKGTSSSSSSRRRTRNRRKRTEKRCGVEASEPRRAEGAEGENKRGGAEHVGYVGPHEDIEATETEEAGEAYKTKMAKVEEKHAEDGGYRRGGEGGGGLCRREKRRGGGREGRGHEEGGRGEGRGRAVVLLAYVVDAVAIQ